MDTSPENSKASEPVSMDIESAGKPKIPMVDFINQVTDLFSVSLEDKKAKEDISWLARVPPTDACVRKAEKEFQPKGEVKKEKRPKKKRSSRKGEKRTRKKEAPRARKKKLKVVSKNEFKLLKNSSLGNTNFVSREPATREEAIKEDFRKHNPDYIVGRDPWSSDKREKYVNIGFRGGNFVKQMCKRDGYSTWKDCHKQQSQVWKHEIWLDPSAPSEIIHPACFHVDDTKILKGKCPTKINLTKEFGNKIEFVYMSPPWKTTLHGNGKAGYFTPAHLDKLDLSCHLKGFVFMWLPFLHFNTINKIMEKKGYKWADSCCMMQSNFEGKIFTDQRNPDAIEGSNDPEDYLGLCAGMKMQGVLYKKNNKERYRIGNQIMYDCFQWRRKVDQYTGQYLPDHGYVYQMYQYLICLKPEKAKFGALHLWCRPTMNIKGFGGVQYFPGYNYDTEELEDFPS